MESKLPLVLRSPSFPPSEESTEDEDLISGFESFASKFTNSRFENNIERKFIFDRRDLENIAVSVQYIYCRGVMGEAEENAIVEFWNRLVLRYSPYLNGWYIRLDNDQLLLKAVFKYNIENNPESAPTTASILFDFSTDLSDIRFT